MFDAVIKDVLNPEGYLPRLFLPFVVAFLAAYFGAKFAATQSRRMSEKKSQIEELQNLVFGLTLASSVCSSALSLKGQHLKRLYEEYNSDRERVKNSLEDKGRTEPIDFAPDLQTLQPINMLVPELVELLNSKVPDADCSLQSVAMLTVYDNVTVQLALRNDWITELRESEGLMVNPIENINAYFGFENGSGMKDSRYSAYISILYESIDELIFHSYSLNRKLTSKAIELGYGKKSKLGKHGVTIPLIKFNEPNFKDLFPDFDKFADWQREPGKLAKKRFEFKKAHYKRLNEALGACSVEQP